MKLTKKELVNIIKEEANKLFTEGEVVDLFPLRGNRRIHPDDEEDVRKKQGLSRIKDEEVEDRVWDMMEEFVNQIMRMGNIDKYDHKETLVGMFADSLDAHDVDDIDS